MEEIKKDEELEELEGSRPWTHKNGEKLIKRNLGLLASKKRSQ